MATTFVQNQTLVVYTCGHCGTMFGAPQKLMEEKRINKLSFFCPNGHERVFRKTTKEELREKITEQERMAEWRNQENTRLRAELKSQTFKTIAERSAKTRLKNRIANGVCPCCHRTFRQLADHMKDMHPEFKPETLKAHE